MKFVPGSININDQNFIAVQTVAEVFSCSGEYVTQLAKDHKIKAVEINQQWYVNDDSFRSYMLVRDQDSDLRTKHEQLANEEVQKKKTYTKQTDQSVEKSHSHVYAHALTLGMFLAGGVAGFYFFNAVPGDMQNNTASVVVTQNVSDLPNQPSDSLRPIFSETDEVRAEQKRFVEHPITQAQWTYINHE